MSTPDNLSPSVTLSVNQARDIRDVINSYMFGANQEHGASMALETLNAAIAEAAFKNLLKPTYTP